MHINIKRDQVERVLDQVLAKEELHVYNYQNLIFGSLNAIDLWKALCDAEHFYQEAFRAVMSPESYREEVIKEAYRLEETKEFAAVKPFCTVEGDKNAWEVVKTALYLHDIAIALKNFSDGNYQDVEQRSDFLLALERVAEIIATRVQALAEAIQNSSFGGLYQDELNRLTIDEYASPLQIFCEEDELVIQGEWSKTLNDPTSGKGLMVRMEGEALRGEKIDVLDLLKSSKQTIQSGDEEN